MSVYRTHPLRLPLPEPDRNVATDAVYGSHSIEKLVALGSFWMEFFQQVERTSMDKEDEPNSQTIE